MANDTTGSFLVLDTAATTLVAGEVTQAWNIRNISFNGYSTITHTAVLKDGGGRIIWQTAGLTDKPAVHSGPVGIVYGLRLTTIGSGQVNVYLE